MTDMRTAGGGGDVRFRVGDVVQLDGAAWSPGHAALEAKCLGPPAASRCGSGGGEEGL